MKITNQHRLFFIFSHLKKLTLWQVGHFLQPSEGGRYPPAMQQLIPTAPPAPEMLIEMNG